MVVSSPVLSAVLGAIIGSLGTYVVRDITRRKREEKKANRLRTALIAEIESIIELSMAAERNYSDTIDDDFERYVQTIQFISDRNKIFTSNTNELGHLTKKEIQALVAFHSMLESAISGPKESKMRSIADIEDGNVESLTKSHLDSLKDNSKQVIEMLENEM
ncbi:hypothetical protein [Haloferax sp. DFSO60]|uniref:hypothetical protein n=1 Tax=Haloferax sp. DFSO60 TaxID=3388652 RepID=UPI003978E459